MAVRKLTAAILEEKRACSEQVALFREVFGEECTVTQENAREAVKAGLSIGWAAESLLDDSAWATYQAATAPAKAAYQAATAPAKAAYVAAWDQAAYKAATAPAAVAYDAARARAFVRVWRMMAHG